MRNFQLSPFVMVLGLFLILSGCQTNRVLPSYGPAKGNLPPGQAKKVYGHQSAKAFAPGQQKKHGTVGYSNGANKGQAKKGKKGKKK